MDKLISFIEDEERQSDLETVENERKKALTYYLPNQKLGNEVEGRSQVVLRDTFDTVEWMMPGLIEVFVSGDQVVKFTPRNQEDVPQAEQESEYINHIVTERNNAFLTFHDWFKDALLSKNGYVKVSVVKKTSQIREQYNGLTSDELALLTNNPEVKILQAEQVMAYEGMEPTFNVILEKAEEYPCIEIDNLRPESVRVSHTFRGVSLADCPFVSHSEYKTLSELREMGLDVDDDISDASGEEWDSTDETRQVDSQWNSDDQDSLDPALRRVLTREIWCRYDRNEDGIAELLHLIVVGRTILLEEEADCIPVACLTPIRVPHRHVGISIADLVMEIQEIRTTLLRNGLDQQYLRNHGRHAVDMSRVNLEDMLVSRPGGIVRVQGDPGSAIFPLVNPQGGGEAVQMIEYMDTVRENRTGITKYNQGLDSQSLNKTATGVNAIQNAAQQRIKLIARLFAETGVKDLFRVVHRMTFKYARKPDIVRLRNQWVAVDPREWTERNDLTISVGLGMGNKDQQLAQLSQVLNFMMQGMQIGVVTPKNIYHAGEKMLNLMGWKDTENWLADPAQQQPKPPEPNPELVKVQQEGQMKQAQMQQEGQIEQAKLQGEFALKQKQIEAEIQLKQWEAQQKMALEREIAFMRLQNEKEVAIIRGAQPLDPLGG